LQLIPQKLKEGLMDEASLLWKQCDRALRSVRRTYRKLALSYTSRMANAHVKVQIDAYQMKLSHLLQLRVAWSIKIAASVACTAQSSATFHSNAAKQAVEVAISTANLLLKTAAGGAAAAALTAAAVAWEGVLPVLVFIDVATDDSDDDYDSNYPYRWELVTGRGWGGGGTASVRAGPQSQLQKYREWQRARREELVLEQGTHYWELELLLNKVGFCGVGLARPNLRRRGPRYWRKECTDAWLLDVGFGSLFGNGKEDNDRAGSFDKGDKVGMLLDLDDGSLLFFKNGEPHGPGYPAGSVTGPVVFALHMRATREGHGEGSPESKQRDRDRHRGNRKGGGKRLYASRKERQDAEERAKQEAEEQARREDEEAQQLATDQARWEAEEEARREQIVICYQSNLNKSAWPYKMEVALYDSTQIQTEAAAGQTMARDAGWAGRARAKAIFHQEQPAESFTDKIAAWAALAGRVKKTKTKRSLLGKMIL
jgi:hypothetical protein